MNNLTICVIYKARGKGEREKYVSELKSSGVLDAILSENGCLAYEYFYSDKDENTLVLFEKWENSECQKIHMTMRHMKTAFEIKDKYIESATLRRLDISEF